jgi:hypothetical protein
MTLTIPVKTYGIPRMDDGNPSHCIITHWLISHTERPASVFRVPTRSIVRALVLSVLSLQTTAAVSQICQDCFVPDPYKFTVIILAQLILCPI